MILRVFHPTPLPVTPFMQSHNDRSKHEYTEIDWICQGCSLRILPTAGLGRANPGAGPALSRFARWGRCVRPGVCKRALKPCERRGYRRHGAAGRSGRDECSGERSSNIHLANSATAAKKSGSGSLFGARRVLSYCISQVPRLSGAEIASPLRCSQ